MGYRETEARQCWKVERHLFYRSGNFGVQRNHEERQLCYLVCDAPEIGEIIGILQKLIDDMSADLDDF